MRVLIFHGYLLRGTGSNEYNAALGEAFARNGHEVAMVSQDRAPLELPWIDAAGDWDGGALSLTARRDPARAIAVFATNFDAAALPPLAVKRANLAFIDSLGVMLAGSRSEPAVGREDASDMLRGADVALLAWLFIERLRRTLRCRGGAGGGG